MLKNELSLGSEEPGSEATQPGDPGQDEVANNSSPRAEKTVTHPEEQKESASPSKNDEARLGVPGSQRV